jgi:hypothetical protein
MRISFTGLYALLRKWEFYCEDGAAARLGMNFAFAA